LKLFNNHIANSTIPGFLKFKILSNEGLKETPGKVSKAQDIVKFMTNYDVIIQINEPIFDDLNDNQKDYIVKDLLAQIHYDLEKDKLNILKPDVTTFSGVLRQYDIDTYLGIKDTITSLMEERKIQEDLAKQAAKIVRA
jgi:hypothetical protein